MIIDVDEKSEKVQKKLEIIKRRIEWLKSKRKGSKLSDGLSMEKDALEWVVTLIEDGVDTTEYAKLYKRYLQEKELEKAKKKQQIEQYQGYVKEVMTAVVA